MKRNTLYTLAVTLLLAACNDYDAAYTPYEETEDDVFTITPPAIDPSWELVLVSNVGQHDENVFVYKDKKYDNLFTRTLGWNGGSGGKSTMLPDGNILWSFNDSYFGVVDPATRARENCRIPHNSLMLQTQKDGKTGEEMANLEWKATYIQTDNPEAEGYYQAYTHIIPSAAGEEDEETLPNTDVYYQAGDAVVIGDKIQLLWHLVDKTQSQSETAWNGTCLAVYDFNGNLIEKQEDFSADMVGYGTTMLEDGDYIYLYASENGRPLVARALRSEGLKSGWQYYIRNTVTGTFEWIDTYPTEDERMRSFIVENGIGLSPWVFKKGDSYYMVMQHTSKDIVYGHNVDIYRSDSPCGPFTDQKTLFTVPYTVDKIGNQYYADVTNINLHPELSREDELVFSVSTSANMDGDNFTYPGSADFTRPYFFRIFNWESLYKK